MNFATLKPINSICCTKITGKCVNDFCHYSGTQICCEKCGSDEHCAQILENYIEPEMVEFMQQFEPDKTMENYKKEAEEIIKQIQLAHKCKWQCPSFNGGGVRRFLLKPAK